MLTYNGSHFNITWAEPLEPNGILNYTVTFTSMNLVTSQQVVLENVVVTELEFLPSQMGEPYTLYTAIVVSQTGGGVGPERRANFTTSQESKWPLYVLLKWYASNVCFVDLGCV